MTRPIITLDRWLDTPEDSRGQYAIGAPPDLHGEAEAFDRASLSSLLLGSDEEELDEMRAAGVDPSNPPDGMLPFTFSTEKRARDGHIIMVDGWRVGNYRKNPVVLADHDYTVERSVGVSRRIWVDSDAKKLRGVVHYQPAERNGGFGRMVYELYRDRWLRSGSIAWNTLKYERDTEGAKEKYGKPWSVRFTEQEPTEFSMIVVPSDPEALQGARSAGICLDPLIDWTERQLDGEASILVPRDALEAAHRIAKPTISFVATAASLEPTDGERCGDPEPTEDPDTVTDTVTDAVLDAMRDFERGEAQRIERLERVMLERETQVATLKRMRDLLSATITDLESDGEPPKVSDASRQATERTPFEGLDPAETNPGGGEVFDLESVLRAAEEMTRS